MQRVETPQSICRFGVARDDITPPVGIYHRMWGAAKHDRSTGIHRPLTATAMVFQQIELAPLVDTRQVLVAVDHCVLGHDELDMIYTAVIESTGIARESISIVCSHTHAAGLMSLDRSSLTGGELIRPYLQQMSHIVADLVRSAAENVQPATITYGRGHCNLATHRDYWDKQDRQWVCGFNPDVPADDTVLVARITAENNRLMAAIVNFACHPTTLAWDNTLISPDFPGAMRQVVEDGTGAPCVFLQGASGDLGPREGFVGDTEIADRNGRQLGYAALSALAALPPANTSYQYTGPVVSGATLGAWSHTEIANERRIECQRWAVDRRPIDLQYRAGLPDRLQIETERDRLLKDEKEARVAGDDQRAAALRALIERHTRQLNRLRSLPDGESFPLEASLWRMGDAVWIALQGEPYSILQTTLRKRFDRMPLVIATIAGSWGASYLPPADVYDKGIYQESIAVLEAGSLERLMDELVRRIENLGV